MGLAEGQLHGLGLMLLLFSGYLVWLATRVQVRRSVVIGVIAADWAWVVGSILLVLLVGGKLAVTGLLLIVAVALVVLVFAVLQASGLKQAGRVVSAA